jgi:hypothetical protein
VNVWRARGGKRGWEGAGAWEKGFEGMRLRKENEREVQEKKGADGIRNAGATIINCTIFKYSTLLCFLAQHFHFYTIKLKYSDMQYWHIERGKYRRMEKSFLTNSIFQ